MSSGSVLVHIADRVINRPLMVLPDKLAVIASVLGGRIGIDASGLGEQIAAGEGLKPDASRYVGEYLPVDASNPNGPRKPYRQTDKGVAIIPLIGSLVNRGSFLDSMSGLTSYERFGHALRAAGADQSVGSIIIDGDTPGGEAIGAMQAADTVREVAAVKPVYSVANGMMASAGYAIASASSRVIVTQDGMLGSIGVVMLHNDYSNKLHQAGIKPTLIHAGARKVDGNPYEPLTADVRSELQAEINRFYDLFVSTVAKGRPGLTEQAIRATEARTFIGADAVNVGLADSVGSFESVLADLSKRSPSRAAPRRRSHSSGLVLEESGPTVGAVPTSVPARAALGAGLTGPEISPGISMAHAGATVSPAAIWDAIVANAEAGARRANVHHGEPKAGALSYGWDEVVADISAHGRYRGGKIGNGWDDIVTSLNANGGVPRTFNLGHGWADVVDRLNVEVARGVAADALLGGNLSAIADREDFGWSDIVAKVTTEKQGRIE